MGRRALDDRNDVFEPRVGSVIGLFHVLVSCTDLSITNDSRFVYYDRIIMCSSCIVKPLPFHYFTMNNCSLEEAPA